MTWKNYKVEQQRLNVVLAYRSGQLSMVDICKQYGISRKTAYKWNQRYLDYGEAGLQDRSKAPHNPIQIYTKDQIALAIDLKLRKRNWGPKKF